MVQCKRIWPVKNLSGGSSKFKAPSRVFSYCSAGMRTDQFSVFPHFQLLGLSFFFFLTSHPSFLTHFCPARNWLFFLLLCVVTPFEMSESLTLRCWYRCTNMFTIPRPGFSFLQRCRVQTPLVWIPNLFLLVGKYFLCKTWKPSL